MNTIRNASQCATNTIHKMPDCSSHNEQTNHHYDRICVQLFFFLKTRRRSSGTTCGRGRRGRRVLSTYCQMCSHTQRSGLLLVGSVHGVVPNASNPHKTLRKKTSKQTLDQFKNVIVAVWSFLGPCPLPQQPFDCRNSFESCSQYECTLCQRRRSIDEASLNLSLIKNTKCDGCGVCVGVQGER